MTTSMRALATVAALALTVAAPLVQATAVWANPNPTNAQLMARDGDTKDKPGRGEGWLQKLNLTPEQTQKIKTIRQQTRTQIQQQQTALRQAQQELQQMISGDASTGQLRDKFQQLQGLRQQLSSIQFNSMLAIRDVLTPEQRRQFAEQMQRQVGGRERSGGDREQSR